MPREQTRASTAQARTAGGHHGILGSTGAGKGQPRDLCLEAAGCFFLRVLEQVVSFL